MEIARIQQVADKIERQEVSNRPIENLLRAEISEVEGQVRTGINPTKANGQKKNPKFNLKVVQGGKSGSNQGKEHSKKTADQPQQKIKPEEARVEVQTRLPREEKLTTKLREVARDLLSGKIKGINEAKAILEIAAVELSKELLKKWDVSEDQVEGMAREIAKASEKDIEKALIKVFMEELERENKKAGASLSEGQKKAIEKALRKEFAKARGSREQGQKEVPLSKAQKVKIRQALKKEFAKARKNGNRERVSGDVVYVVPDGVENPRAHWLRAKESRRRLQPFGQRPEIAFPGEKAHGERLQGNTQRVNKVVPLHGKRAGGSPVRFRGPKAFESQTSEFREFQKREAQKLRKEQELQLAA